MKIMYLQMQGCVREQIPELQPRFQQVFKTTSIQQHSMGTKRQLDVICPLGSMHQ